MPRIHDVLLDPLSSYTRLFLRLSSATADRPRDTDLLTTAGDGATVDAEALTLSISSAPSVTTPPAGTPSTGPDDTTPDRATPEDPKLLHKLGQQVRDDSLDLDDRVEASRRLALTLRKVVKKHLTPTDDPDVDSE